MRWMMIIPQHGYIGYIGYIICFLIVVIVVSFTIWETNIAKVAILNR